MRQFWSERVILLRLVFCECYCGILFIIIIWFIYQLCVENILILVRYPSLHLVFKSFCLIPELFLVLMEWWFALIGVMIILNFHIFTLLIECTWEGITSKILFHQVCLSPVASASSSSWLETRDMRCHPDLLNQKLHFNKIPK